MTGLVVFVLKGYPRLSETFIAQEIKALEDGGMPLQIWALRQPTDKRTHPIHNEIKAAVGYLPEYLHDDPSRVIAGLFKSLLRPGFGRALLAFIKDLPRDISRNRIRRFGQACVLASEMPRETARIHAHFIHTPASVARYASLIAGLPWSISAHAKDIWTSPGWELADKLAAADWTVTCTKAGLEQLNSLAPPHKPAFLVYHGLDLSRFAALPMPLAERDGRDAAKPARLLTVARAVEKKGLDTLLDALALLPKEMSWQWTHVGGGEGVSALRAQAARLGIAQRCDFRGALDQIDVLGLYRNSDLFVLPCRIASDGDRDGLPNVLVEAASQALAALSTPISGVVELIDDGVNGALCPPDDPTALATRMAGLIGDPHQRYRLGQAAMKKVRSRFDHNVTIGALRTLFASGREGLLHETSITAKKADAA
ncbi:MAG: glycosyltransferase family 4 protein [Bosea sp. (in: a-proteobacteria)]